MKIFITGGAGFLGSNITEFLKNRAEIVILDNFTTSNPNNIEVSKNIKLIEGTIANSDLVEKIIQDFKPMIVIHSAASYKDPNNWKEDIDTNITGTANIIRSCEKIDIKKIIYFQTALCYGKPKEKPITLSHPLAPFTSYSISKTAGEDFIKLSNLPFISLRLSNIYGPKHFSGPIPTFYKRLKAEKECFVVDTRRDFLELQDFLDLIDKILATNICGIYNVSSGKDCSIKEIFDLIVKELDIKLEREVKIIDPDKDDVNSLLLDPFKTEEDFNWRAEVKLEQGIKKIVKWYEKNGVDQAYTHLKIGDKN